MRPATLVFTASLLLAFGCGDVTDSKTITGPDTALMEVTFPDIEQEVSGTEPVDFGAPCRDNRDCLSNWCVQGPDGNVCTRTCVEDCPSGWRCVGVTGRGVDVVFICLPDGPSHHEDVVDGDTSPPLEDTSPPPEDTSPPPEDTTPPQDTSQPPVASLCDVDLGVGTEAFMTEAADWPDCVTGCPHAALPGLVEIDLGGPGVSAGALGLIDGDEHTYSVGLGPDIDVIALRAAPRTMIELAVQAASPGALIDPVVYVSDSFQVRTFNSRVSSTNPCARTSIAFPFASQSPIFVVIEDAINYAAWTPTGYGETVGGANYGYTLRLRTTPFAPVALGQAAVGQTLGRQGEVLSLGGETRYYTFTAPANSTPTVTLTRTGSASFVPAVAVFKSDQDQMVWQSVAWDADGNGEVVQVGGFITCPGCGSAPAEHYLAVMDWNGRADPGVFSFDLHIAVD